MSYELSHLQALEAEAIHIMREVAAEFERPVLLFSGGKDSIVLLRLAEKAFWPGKFPFPLMHVDTGHNFPEAIEYRDRRVEELDARLIVAHVQDSIDAGRVVDETGPRRSRNRLQTTTLLDAIAEHKFDAAFQCFRVAVNDQLHAGRVRGTVAQLVHGAEFPGGIDMEQREGRRCREESLLRQVQHHRAVLAHRIEHDGLRRLGHHLAHDVDSLRLEALEMGEGRRCHIRSAR